MTGVMRWSRSVLTIRNVVFDINICLLQKMKEAMIRKDKGEEEFTELSLKARTLEIDLDKYAEKLEKQVMAQESKEAQVLAAEAEFNRLNRRSVKDCYEGH